MSLKQIIFTNDNPAEALRWVHADGSTIVASGVVASLVDYAQMQKTNTSGELIVILPGERFSARQIVTPAKNRQQILQSARFLLEDDLAGPVDTLHLAVMSGAELTKKTVVAAELAYVEAWLEQLKKSGLLPDILSVDFLCLAGMSEEDTPIVLLENNRVQFFGDGNGFVAERSFAEDMVAILLTEQDSASALVYGLKGEAPLALPGIEHSFQPLDDENDLISFYVAAIEGKTPPNLLQGSLTQTQDWRAMMGHWRLVAGLAAACLMLFLGSQVAEGARLNGAARKIEQAAAEQFKTAYPDVRIRNLRSSARQYAGAKEGGGGYFLDLSAILSEALQEGGAVQLLTISYKPSGQLVAEVKGAAFDDIDALEERLAAKGITVSQGRNATQDDSGYTAKVFLEAGV